MKPLSLTTATPVDQDIRAALIVFESIENYVGPNPKVVNAVLENGPLGATYIMIKADTVERVPVAGGGWDFTLGITYDFSTRTGTSFYYPVNQPSQSLVLTSVSMSGWTNIQAVLYALFFRLQITP